MRWLILAIALFIPSLADAACGGSSPNWTVAATALSTDLDDCVTAASNGDTITFPGGTFTWTASSTFSNKYLTIQGVGAGTPAQCAVGAQTTYTCIQRAGKMIDWTLSSSGMTTLKNFSIIGNTSASGCALASNHLLNFRGNSDLFRMTGMVVRIASDNSCAGVLFRGSITGVVDHNTFEQDGTVAATFVIAHESWKTVGDYGDNSWAQADSMGEAGNGDALYLEDNVFNGNHPSSTNTAFSDNRRGTRWVARFNQINGGKLDHHGTESDGRPRGPRHFEGYRNHFSSLGKSLIVGFSLRGVGTARIFDNSIPTEAGSYTSVVDFNTIRRDPVTSAVWVWGACGVQTTITGITRSGTTATVTTSSQHYIHASGGYARITGANEANFNTTGKVATRVSDTSFTYTVADSGATTATGTPVLTSPWDSNDDATGYKCIDQVGSGQGDYLSSEFPVTPLGWPNQVRRPYYIFNNINEGSLDDGQNSAPGADVVTENVDYYNQNASFTGATGIGRGARSSRPATCTTGVGYWSTDGGGNWNTSTTETFSDTPGEDGALDICTATNTWTDDAYVPYTYPHPLTLTADSSPTRAPGGLRFSGGARF